MKEGELTLSGVPVRTTEVMSSPHNGLNTTRPYEKELHGIWPRKVSCTASMKTRDVMMNMSEA
jgi:hypothetical protein